MLPTARRKRSRICEKSPFNSADPREGELLPLYVTMTYGRFSNIFSLNVGIGLLAFRMLKVGGTVIPLNPARADNHKKPNWPATESLTMTFCASSWLRPTVARCM